MQNMRDPRLLRLPDFIFTKELLAQIQEMGVKISACDTPWVWEPSDRSRFQMF